MSDTFDHYQDALDNDWEIDDDEVNDRIRKLSGVWTMRDGKEIKFVDMATSHLKNTIALHERKDIKLPDGMADEYKRRLTNPT